MKLRNVFLFLIIILFGCSDRITEKTAIITKIENGNDYSYKYKLTVYAFPSSIEFYTNKKYDIGDTLRFTK